MERARDLRRCHHDGHQRGDSSSVLPIQRDFKQETLGEDAQASDAQTTGRLHERSRQERAAANDRARLQFRRLPDRAFHDAQSATATNSRRSSSMTVRRTPPRLTRPPATPSVKVIHQENKGHGGRQCRPRRRHRHATCASSTPITGWNWRHERVLDLLREEREAGRFRDLLVTNYVYDKQESRSVIRYRNVLLADVIPGWADLRRCYDQYLMWMHAPDDAHRGRGLVCGCPSTRSTWTTSTFRSCQGPSFPTIRYQDVDLYLTTSSAATTSPSTRRS